MYILHKTVNKITQLVLHAVGSKNNYVLVGLGARPHISQLKKLYVGLVISCGIADGFYDNCFHCSVSSCPVIGFSVPKCCLGSFL